MALNEGDVVTKGQLKLLFGQGRHPRADEAVAAAHGWGALGRAFPRFETATLRRVTARAYGEHNTDRGLAWKTPIPVEVRASIRARVAQRMFLEAHGRAPVDEAEMTRFVAKATRPPQVPLAGFDLTFSPVKSVSALWALAPSIARVARTASRCAASTCLATGAGTW